jgi:hypothetical protein
MTNSEALVNVNCPCELSTMAWLWIDEPRNDGRFGTSSGM